MARRGSFVRSVSDAFSVTVMKERLGNLFSEEVNGKNVIKQITTLLPNVMVLLSFVTTIVAYIMFIVGGGYSEQIKIIKKEGIFKAADAFTRGKAYYLTSGIILNITLIILGIFIILLVARIITDTSQTMRLIMIIDAAVLFVVSWLPVYAVTLYYGMSGDKPREKQEAAWNSMQKLSKVMENKIVLAIYGGLALIALITFLVLLVINAITRYHLKIMGISVMIHFIILPAVLWFFQNIIPLIAAIVSFAILGTIVVVVIKMIIANGAERDVTITVQDKYTGEIISKSEGTYKE